MKAVLILTVVGLLVPLAAIWVVDHCLSPDPEDEGADHV